MNKTLLCSTAIAGVVAAAVGTVMAVVPATAGGNGTQRYTNTQLADDGDTVLVLCPAGTLPVGGGAGFTGNVAGIDGWSIAESRPSSRAWAARVDGPAGERQVSVTVYCE